ncbi:MAG: thiamine-phosphate kinase [Bacteroidales bacterium]|nr:thiamine-phosphate kinase [Bacteroidales bacterium]
MKTGEFDLIGRISAQVRSNVPDGVIGIGDDCAVIPQKEGLDTLVTTDLLVEDRHFLLDDIGPFDLGWKSAAVNISDIAAMGGRPESAFLSIALPGCIDSEWVERFIAGFMELADRYGVALLGGDTSASPDKLFINITLLGSCRHGAALTRSGARPGDLVCVTGTLGDSAAGLTLILEHSPDAVDYLRERHYHPEPRVREGIALAATAGVHSMMDISDGIASDLPHILEASEVGAEIDLRRLPLSQELMDICAVRGWDAAELAVGGGEDYELLLTVAPEAYEAASAAVDGSLTAIGRIVESGEPAIRWTGGKRNDYKGFTHF